MFMKSITEASTDDLMERMRSVTQFVKCDLGSTHSITRFLEVEAEGDNIWVVRYQGITSVIGNEGLHIALVTMAKHLKSINIYI